MSNISPKEEHKCDKQFYITFEKNGERCNIYIGTIDSFVWRIGKPNKNEKDMFVGIIKNIINSETTKLFNGRMNYAGNSIDLNKKTLVIIDEGQDLHEDYIKAIARVMRDTYIDVSIVGDKLQSISNLNNAFTFLERTTLCQIHIFFQIHLVIFVGDYTIQH